MRLSAAALLLVSPILAQEPAPPTASAKPAAESKPAAPPDRKAFADARGQKDPVARLAALERFVEDFPASPMASMARREVITAALAVDPTEAVSRAKTLAWKLDPAETSALNRHLAVELVREKKLLPEAEEAARAALSQLTFEAFESNAKQRAGANGDPDGEATGARARFQVEKALLNETLAQVVLASGRTGEARGLFELALRDNPSLSPAALGLATLAEADGKPGEALDYYAQAMLAKPSPESRGRFNESWSKLRGGTEGQQGWLDQRYRTLFPSPLHPEIFTATAQRTRRVVLAELYTGAGCPPCLAADLAFDSMLERYSRSDFVFVAYHQHIPRPDPMANADTIARWKWQQGRGVPTYAVDGAPIGSGGGGREAAPLIESLLRRRIDARLETAPQAALLLDAALTPSKVNVSAQVAGIEQPSGDLELTVVLVEKEITYSGENSYRFHPMVARSIASFKLDGAKARSVNHRFDISAVQAALARHIDKFEKFDERHNKDGNFRFAERKSAVDPSRLAVVAFIQNRKTREILQAAYCDPVRR